MTDRRPSYVKAGPPQPLLEFTIPSLHDSLELDCRIYAPSDARSDPEATGGLGTGKDGLMRGAVVAHPYAPTGGCYDDRVLMACVETLLAGGWTVGTFNFRGVKGGRGSTSWTAKPEAADFRSMVGLLVSYLAGMAWQTTGASSELEIDLILGGYSYGSMVMSQIGDVAEVLAPFNSPQPGSPAESIRLRAEDLVERTRRLELNGSPGGGPPRYQTAVIGGDDPKQPTTQVTSVTDRKTLPVVRPKYLLVSPLLGPVAGILNLGLPSVPKGIKNLFRRTDAADEADDSSVCSMESPLFLQHPTLAVFGAEETFTSAKKLTSWAEKMHAASPVRPAAMVGGRQGSYVPHLFEWDIIEDAGHFWRETSVEGILRGKIKNWAAGL